MLKFDDGCYAFLRPYQKFNIALRPGDGAGGESVHCPIFFDQPHFNLVANACVDVWVPDHTAFANFFASSLKLRLDERN